MPNDCDITVILMTKNEGIHIERCLHNLRQFARAICIVDSYSSDDTIAICRQSGASVYQNQWVNYATQFNWAVDNVDIRTPWTMRFDADEYCEGALLAEIGTRMPTLPADVNGVVLKRKVIFMDRWIRHGFFYPQRLLRIWRTGQGRIEQRWMDEHIVLDNPRLVEFRHDLVDHNLRDIGWWIDKHNAYAVREMIDLLLLELGKEPDRRLEEQAHGQALWKRRLKQGVYAALPPGPRAMLYFLFRYLVGLGFLDGHEGLHFHTFQGLWYRLLVDAKLTEVQRRAKAAGVDQLEMVRRLHGYDVR